ncbi:BSD domain-containing protein 1-like isoform X1 [Ornithodoros turicata]|uniref:BSD domain-containing protein 1-like isoform X1 n=1 Tax=Ornithodoros turicata TaxID=34597 RepID=UPI0031389870
MAEASNPDETSPWWNSWLESAKEKSTAAYEFFKRDLTEFSTTVQQDTVTAVSSTAAFVRDKLRLDDEESVTTKAKEGISTLIGTISEALSPSWDPADDELSVIKNHEIIPVERWQASLHSILVDRNTYCHEPDCPPEVYESWLETFNLEEHKEEVAEILVNYDEAHQLYNELVPSAVSHEEFWERYFFRVFQLREAEEELVNSVQQSSSRLSVGDSESKPIDVRCSIVPPNTPNVPSAEQSISNSPTSKSAPPVEQPAEQPEGSTVSSESNGKDLSDWEKDFAEEDIADGAAKETEDDWETWD